MAFELPDHTSHGVGDERVAVAGVVAIDGGDQPGPGGLAQVLGSGPAAGAVAVSQPVSQAEIRQDDSLAQNEIAAAGVVQQPAIDLAGSGRVAGPHRHDLTDGSLCGCGCHRSPSKSWLSAGAEQTSNTSSTDGLPRCRRFANPWSAWPGALRAAQAVLGSSWLVVGQSTKLVDPMVISS